MSCIQKITVFFVFYLILTACGGTITQDGVIYTTYSNHAVISGLTNSYPSKLTIPSKVSGVDVTEVAEDAFDDVYLNELTLPNTITVLRTSAFYGTIKKLTLGSGLKTIERGAFDDVYGLLELTVPDSVTSIGYKAFDIDELETISLPSRCSLSSSTLFSSSCPLKSIYIRGGMPNYTINLDSFTTKPTIYLEVSGVSELWGCPVVYNNPKAIAEIAIIGTTAIDYGEKASFTCTATLRNGTKQEVVPVWSVSNTTYASVTKTGIVTNKNTGYTVQNVTLNASYTQDGLTKSDKVVISLAGRKNELTGLEVVGESNLVTGVEYTYTAYGRYADGSKKIVTPTWSIIEGEQFAVLSDKGVLNMANVPAEVSIVIQAEYTEDEISKNTQKTLYAKPAVFQDSIFEYTYVLNPGWQLISIVLNLDNASKNLLLSFKPYSYDQKRYVQASDLTAGTSYWIYVPTKTLIKVSGTPCGVLKK